MNPPPSSSQVLPADVPALRGYLARVALNTQPPEVGGVQIARRASPKLPKLDPPFQNWQLDLAGRGEGRRGGHAHQPSPAQPSRASFRLFHSASNTPPPQQQQQHDIKHRSSEIL